jgi:hypothetical protein
VKVVAQVLKVEAEQARRLVYSLRSLGYVEVVSRQPPGTWRNTMAGNALANATAAAPISRAQAELLLRGTSLFESEVSIATNPSYIAWGKWSSSAAA